MTCPSVTVPCMAFLCPPAWSCEAAKCCCRRNATNNAGQEEGDRVHRTCAALYLIFPCVISPLPLRQPYPSSRNYSALPNLLKKSHLFFRMIHQKWRHCTYSGNLNLWWRQYWVTSPYKWSGVGCHHTHASYRVQDTILRPMVFGRQTFDDQTPYLAPWFCNLFRWTAWLKLARKQDI